jgi:DNA polymerase III alpha subunit (gram-positive type)
MKFAKDILVIDFEGTVQPVQIGAVLLDKESLTEKDHFLSYIYADLQGKVDGPSGITQEKLKGAPTQAEVGKTIQKQFGTNVFIASWVANMDMKYFARIIEAAGTAKWTAIYDYHVLDIWPLAYVYLLKRNFQPDNFRSEQMFQAFGAKPRKLHNALEDARIAADVLRKVTATDT